jgi:transposase
MKETLKMSVKEADRIPIAENLVKGTMTIKNAAQTLNLSTRQVKRIKKSFKLYGVKGLIHKSRGKVSKRKISEKKKARIISLVRKHYWDFGPTFACEKLTENHDISVSVETLRKMMIEAGIWKAKKRKKPSVHQQRERRSAEGELEQMDGSPHNWFEGRSDRCCLLLAIDDATGKIKEALFVKAETTNGYFALVRNYFDHHGKPLAFYVDRNSIFKNNNNKVNPETLTQFTQAMRELLIEVICANSPQAKGRVENKNKTLQDRLVKEMRLRNISSMEEANKFLPEFIRDFNKRFAVEPKDSRDAHRPLLSKEKENLDKILVKKYVRILSKNLEFQFEGKLYQIITDRPTYTMRHAPVLVTRDTKDKVRVYYKDKELEYKVVDKTQKVKVKSSKEVNNEVDKSAKRKTVKPASDHPWRYFTI